MAIHYPPPHQGMPPTAISSEEEGAFFQKWGIFGSERECVLRAASLLDHGITVNFTMNGKRSMCAMTLRQASHPRDRSLWFSTNLLVPLRDVSSLVCEYRKNKGGSITCGAQKHKETHTKGFSFVCVGPCSASVTKAISLVLAFTGQIGLDIRGVARHVSCEFNTPARPSVQSLSGHPQPPSTSPPEETGRGAGGKHVANGEKSPQGQFTSFLAPTGLGHIYEAVFNDSGLEYQDLHVVNREDLEKLLGITNRLHQIKILTQIRLQFHEQGDGSRAGSGYTDHSDFLAEKDDVLEQFGRRSIPTRRRLLFRSTSSYCDASIARVGGGGGGGGGDRGHPGLKDMRSSGRVDVSHDTIMSLLA